MVLAIPLPTEHRMSDNEQYELSLRALRRRLLLPDVVVNSEIIAALTQALPARPSIAQIAETLGADCVYATVLLLSLEWNSAGLLYYDH